MNPLWPGHPYPLGATFDGSGVNSPHFSAVADKVEVARIDDACAETRAELTESETDDVAINAVRDQKQREFLTALLHSQGGR